MDDNKPLTDAERSEIQSSVQNSLLNQGVPESGIKSIKVNDNGIVQITFEGAKKQTATLTYDYNGKNNVCTTFMNGTWAPGAAASDVMNDYVYENETDYYSVIYNSTANPGEVDDYIEKAKQAVNLSSNGRNIYGGASAGAQGILKEAKNDPTGVFDIVLCDAAKNGDSVPFVDTMLKDPELMKTMHDNNNIVYAYESTGGLTGTPGSAIKQFVKLAKDEENPVTVIVGVNDELKEHTITTNDINRGVNAISPEDMIVNGTLTNIANGFPEGQLVDSSVNGTETRYFYLNTPEFLNDNWKEVFTENGYTIISRDTEEDLSHTEAELSNYVNSIRDNVSQTFMEMGKADEMNKIAEESYSSIAGLTYQVYSDVVDAANTIIKSSNDTKCSNKGITDYEFFNDCTSEFPKSLNDSNSFLYSITSNLINDVNQDMHALQQVLEGKKSLEDYLVSQTALLSDGSFDGTNPDTTFNVTNTAFAETTFTELFTSDIKEGSVGKISVSDLMKAISPDGVIMSGLNNEIQDANDLSKYIGEFMGSLSMQGEDWQAVKDHLSQYQSLCEDRVSACQLLQDAYERAAKLITDYISPDEDMDDGRIPEFTAKINRLQRSITEARHKISDLKAQNTSLSQIKLVTWSSYDIWTKTYVTYSNASQYNAAQAQIAANNTSIANLNAQIDIAEEAKKEAEEYKARLVGLHDIVNKANGIISDAMSEVYSTYGASVDDYQPVSL